MAQPLGLLRRRKEGCPMEVYQGGAGVICLKQAEASVRSHLLVSQWLCAPCGTERADPLGTQQEIMQPRKKMVVGASQFPGVHLALSLCTEPSVSLIGGLLLSFQRDRLSAGPLCLSRLLGQPSGMIFCSSPIFMSTSIFLMSALNPSCDHSLLQLKAKN